MRKPHFMTARSIEDERGRKPQAMAFRHLPTAHGESDQHSLYQAVETIKRVFPPIDENTIRAEKKPNFARGYRVSAAGLLFGILSPFLSIIFFVF